MSQAIYQVALPTPLRRVFDYLAPSVGNKVGDKLAINHESSVAIGARVKVSFGHQELIGIVVRQAEQSQLPVEQLKPILEVLDKEPLLPADTLKLITWGADYYQHPLGEALDTALPVLLRQGHSTELPATLAWSLTTEGKGLPDTALQRAPKQAEALRVLLSRKRLRPEELPSFGITSTPLKQLQKKGLADLIPFEAESSHGELLAQPPLALNDEQAAALSQVAYRKFGCYLLEGATGSGKTEVYLQAIQKVLEQGKRALVLVPEIGLTPQLVSRFTARFNRPIATLHSGLNDKERLHAWLKTANGAADILIGTRSAVFTPIPDLGLIIIDEEHDLSFKQQDGFRYSARDLAIVRAQQTQIPLILGTATPSLETLFNATQQRYEHLRLTKRAGNATAPIVELLDIRGQKLEEGFSPSLLAELESTLSRGDQALVFLNRRGFAPVMLCHDCGWIAGCSACSARLTRHQHPPHLRCHHCDQQRPIPRQCPDCRSTDLDVKGFGTERVENFLAQRFALFPVIRIDRDSTRRKNAMNDLLAPVHQGEPCILVGTQMLAKGHHFPDVTLVAMTDIDGALFSGDFRAPERLGQLLIQVAGRAGRAEKKGKVIIQSHQIDHPSIQSLVKEGYHRYARRLLQERQVAGLPPYQFMALIRAESKRAENAIELLQLARQAMMASRKPSPELRHIGPLPGLMERKKDRYCFQLQIIAQQRKALHQTLAVAVGAIEGSAVSKRARWSIDVDPQDMA